MIRITLLVALCLWMVSSQLVHDFKGFDDTILFDIDWRENREHAFNPEIEDEYLINTEPEFEYSCVIPKLESKTNESKALYTGPAPLELLATLFKTSSCSYRIESYWTYEVCHGDYIKQYHEEREGKTTKTQEYFLGRWTQKDTEHMREKIANAEPALSEKIAQKKVEGVSLPYVAIEMTDGTPCALIENKPRVTRVLYVCFAHGKNEVYSLEEVSTCTYEVVILTSILCSHPDFKPHAIAENRIRCSPTSKETPVVPKSTWNPSLMLREKKGSSKPVDDILDDTQTDDFSKIMAGLEAIVKIQSNSVPGVPPTPPHMAPAGTMMSHWVDFMSGQSCRVGGHGWWKYEFCFGRHVRQFHKTKDGETSVVLGKYDMDAHLKWIQEHPEKLPQPKGDRPFVSHYYPDGEFCELSGKPRVTEVRLKCMENAATHNDVRMYLIENECEYMLSVETPMACELIRNADPHTGLLNMSPSLAKLRANANLN